MLYFVNSCQRVLHSAHTFFSFDETTKQNKTNQKTRTHRKLNLMSEFGELDYKIYEGKQHKVCSALFFDSLLFGEIPSFLSTKRFKVSEIVEVA